MTSISQFIEKLRACCQVDVLSSWQSSAGDVPVNAKGQIGWAGGKQVLLLSQKLVVPEDLAGYGLQGLCLRLALVWWADSVQVYVNGELVGEGDLFDCSPRVLVSPGVMPGEEFVISLRLVSPSHCDGALVKSLLVYESPVGVDPGFFADELASGLILEGVNQEGVEDLIEATKIFEEGVNRLAYGTVREGALAVSLPLGKDALAVSLPLGKEYGGFLGLREELVKSKIQNLKSKIDKIYLLGHAHLDLAWLWRVSETWRVGQCTFESVLSLQEDFEELVFCHSTPALYAWVEENRPDLFEKIRCAVAAGRWEVVGGFWVEPELNLIAGESIVRQLLYGQRYVLEKFGKVCSVVWVPDTFGFCGTLPQFLVGAGVEFFVTQKLRWNDTTKFDYDAFWWRSPDGSEIFSLMSALIGEGIDPVKMAGYVCEWKKQTGLDAPLWLPGVGDHGGGPTRDMLERARRFSSSPLFPDLEFISAEAYLQLIRSQLTSDEEIESNNPKSKIQNPKWNDELYLEFHRGCYTTHGDQKRWNRRCEGLLYEAELFAALACIGCGVSYPQAELEAAWKKVLFNQFHDILPGSSITEVYEDALPEWQAVEKVGTDILELSLQAIASQVSLPIPPNVNCLPIIVFNSLNWQRSEVVEVISAELSHQAWEVYDLDFKCCPSQVSAESTLLFLANDIPSVGYKVFWLCPVENVPKPEFVREDFILENEFLQVTVDEETGNLSSVFDKVNQKEVLSGGGGNELQAFQDSGQYWDAWNIDPNYAQHPLPPASVKSIQWLDQGLVQNRVRVVRQIGKSEFCCDYILQVQSPILKIATTVNWQENQVLVKAAFPISVEADFATYEIPCGAIRRPTKPQTKAEAAKWEVPALRWADLADSRENQYGVSLLNDCKYGYDCQPSQLRLTLLRSPNWPDAHADRGVNEFTYALYPHAGSWESAHTVCKGYELNHALKVKLMKTGDNQKMPPVGSFLNLSADNLILMAFKQAEDEQHWIIRCYECYGNNGELCLQSDLGLSLGKSVDLLERPLCGEEESLIIRPWKISSFTVINPDRVY